LYSGNLAKFSKGNLYKNINIMQAARRALQLVKKSLAEFGGVSRQIKSKSFSVGART
jgi:hypothetical protein